MPRFTRSTLRIKSRTVAVERKAIQTARPVAHRKPARAIGLAYVPLARADLDRPILAEVARCLAHRPLQFPQKLWGDVL